jgi:hypothetical protein
MFPLPYVNGGQYFSVDFAARFTRISVCMPILGWLLASILVTVRVNVCWGSSHVCMCMFIADCQRLAMLFAWYAHLVDSWLPRGYICVMYEFHACMFSCVHV